MKAPDSKTILVTGGAGYIGSHTVHFLHEKGHKVIVLDNLCYGHPESLATIPVTLIHGDIGDRDLLTQIFSEHQIHSVIHFAAFAYVGESVTAPLKYYQNNLAAPLTLLAAMQAARCLRFVFSSTCATYGEPDQQPITESTPQLPINPYGKSKLMLETVLRDCDHAWGLKSVCLRYFNACGAHPDAIIGEDHSPETPLIPLILDVAAGTRQSITIFGTDYPTPDGTCIRDYIHVLDLATAHLAAIEFLHTSTTSLACNLGTGHGVSVSQVISAVEKITGRKIPTILGARRPGDPPALIADPSLALEKLHWKALYLDIHQPIAHAWAWRSGPSNGSFPRHP